MSDALLLPPRPNLEQYKKLAKDLQDACQSSSAGAIRQWATRWLETLAQLQGEAGLITSREREAERMQRRWNKLKEAAGRGSGCTLAIAQFFIAREHGFASWRKFTQHLQELARANSPVSAYEAAADAIASGDLPTLRKLLADQPGLARERSTREHRSTLLHYVSANGVEDFRQKTPKNIIEITNLLLDAGCEVNAESDAYGGGCTTLGLVATSIHPERAGVQIALLRTLLDRGATFQQPSAGGNQQSIVHACLANGQPKAASFFADLGAHVDLESAAALGRLDVVQDHLDASGEPRRDDHAKQIESAFRYACGYGSRAVAEFLLDRGVDPATRDKDGRTGLHWAAYGPHIEIIQLLLDRGTPVDLTDTTFQATAGDMVLWTWDNTSSNIARERCYEAIALLAKAGAQFDPNEFRDAHEERTTILERVSSDPRMLAALRW